MHSTNYLLQILTFQNTEIDLSCNQMKIQKRQRTHHYYFSQKYDMAHNAQVFSCQIYSCKTMLRYRILHFFNQFGAMCASQYQ